MAVLDILKVIHIINAILMAWPFYALVTVNQRVRLGPPQIDTLFAKAGNPIQSDVAAQIGELRLRRKRVASVCMFVVLISAMLGVQVWTAFPQWLTVLLTLAIAAFTWRAYKSVTPYGWV